MPVQGKCRNRHPPLDRGCEQLVTSPCTSKRDRAAAWRAHNASLPAQRACATDLQGTLQTSDQHAAPPGLIRNSEAQLGSRHYLDIMHQASADQHVCCPMKSAAGPSQLSALQAATKAVIVSFQDLLQPHAHLAPGQAHRERHKHHGSCASKAKEAHLCSAGRGWVSSQGW